MSVYQATSIPAVSLPNGANSLPIEVIEMLEPFQKIILWMDDDLKGKEGAEKFASKLGLTRCYIVEVCWGDLERALHVRFFLDLRIGFFLAC